jgi:sulfotransferase family protein
VKIFGIGLSRTGTHSLGSALTTLGFKSVHFPCDGVTREEIYRHFALGASSLRLSLLDLVDAVVDTPVTCVYKALDQRYPGSRFVLTTRDMDSWLNSCERYWSETLRPSLRPDSGNPYHQYIQFVNRRVYGTERFDADLFQRAYMRHLTDVRRHFRHRQSDLLVIDIPGGEGWEILAPFVAAPAPTGPFPSIA